MGDVRYATTVDGLSIAYLVEGAGPLDVALVPGTVSHVELMREIPSFPYMFDRLSRSYRFYPASIPRTPPIVGGAGRRNYSKTFGTQQELCQRA
jgi:hypothetical protein